MPGTYNANAVVQQLADAVAMDPKLKGELYSRLLESAAMQYNAFEKFTSVVNPKSNIAGGVRSIFCKKTDLRAGGADTVNFNVIGPPGGGGVMGSQELTGNTSKAKMATYAVRVGWHRDAFEMDREMIEFLSAGRSLQETTFDLLGQKMGLLKQNHMMMRLIKSVDGNIYRPNNRPTTNDLLATDTLSLSMAHSGRARLRTIGGQPIKHRVGGNGSPVDGYLIFASDMAMLPIRNDDGYQVALANGHTRGEDNANFSGDLIPWGGMPWFEHPTVDMPWDDYIGSPILPKAKNAVAFSTATAGASCILKGETYLASPTPGTPRYFQFFNGFGYKFNADESPSADGATYYAWVINPDGTLAFISYVGSDNNGNSILVTNILASAAGVSTKGAATVGEFTLGSGSSGTTTLVPGSGHNMPADFVYTSVIQAGAVVIQANSKGVQLGRSFVFGAMAACFGNGRIEMNQIEEKRDYGFALGKGFETIFGTGVTKNPLKKPVGYLLVEHALEHEGYPTPSLT